MHKVFLSLGSNLGNRILNLQNALHYISEQLGDIKSVSALYETEPWGFDSDNKFVNTAIKLETNLNSNELLQKCMWVENKLGRKRNKTKLGYSSRIIDVDILFFDDEIINLANLIIPHTHLHKRKFVLEPMLEIAPDWKHPILHKTAKEMLLT